MTEIRSIAGANTYLARETTPGTEEVTGFFGMPSLRMRPGFDGESEVVRGGSGKSVSSVLLTDIKGDWNVETFSADFNGLGVPAASVLSLPVTTTPGGGTNSRQHVFSKNPNTTDTKRTYTARWGDGYYGFKAVYGYFNSLGMDIQRGELSFDTSFRSRRPQANFPVPVSEVQTLTITGSPTGGTFTLTYAGQTTSPIQWNAAASAVQSALIALSNIGPLDVTAAGGPLPATPVTITFGGALAQTDVALITDTSSLTGGTTPDAAVAQTTAGSVPADIAQAPMPSTMWDIYIDDTWAGLGTTKYGGAYVFNPQFGDKYEEDAPLNSSIESFEEAIEAEEQEDTIDLTVRLGATGLSLIGSFDVGELVFVRASLSSANAAAIAKGTAYYIEGAIPWSCNIDLAMIVTSLGTIETAPNSSVQVLPLSGVIAKDGANMARLTLVNTVLAY
jgi:hypothetical protein